MQEKYIYNAVSGKSSRPLVCFLLTFMLALLAVQKAPGQTFVPQTPITFPSNIKNIGHFDISWIDKYARVYVLANDANASVDMVELNSTTLTMITPTGTGAFVGKGTDPNSNPNFNDISGPNGVTIVNHAEIWAGDAPTFSGPIVANANLSVAYATDNCDSSVKVVSLISLNVTDVISTGGCFRADELSFDIDHQAVLIANDAEENIGKGPSVPFITLIDANPVAQGAHHPIITKITFDGTNGTPNALGGIEQSVYSPETGYFYVSVPQDGPNATVGAVAVVSAYLARRGDNPIVQKYELPGCSPTGATLGPNHELFLGCGEVIDIRDGSVLASFPKASGCDEVNTNPTDNLFLCGQSAGALGIVNSQTLQFIQSVPGFNRSVAADPVSLRIFGPSAANAVGGLCGAASAVGCIAVIAPAATQASVTPLTLTTSNSSVTLDGSASTTATPGTISYLFSVVPGSPVPAILQSPNSPKATVQFITAGTYMLQLTVTDANGTSSTSPVITLIYQPSAGGSTGGPSPVTIVVNGPTGSAGSTANSFNTANGQITLTATASSTNPGTLTYSWTPANAFQGGSISANTANTSSVSIELPSKGAYTFNLTVTDAKGASATTLITVNYN